MASPHDETQRLAGATAPAPGATELARWRRVKEIFVEVVERERDERERLLAELAAHDLAAAAEARSLLRRYDDAATDLLARGPLLGVPEQEEAPDLTGRAVGGYRLTAALGRGGMGMVYAAVREEDGKRAAVKLLRWRGDPRDAEAAVKAERRILAGLEHDNIARLIDGGVTADGLPFFTLELIEGQPIDAYCDARAVDVTARLRLFIQVCAAVEHAHQRLVIHCDLKPANILVTTGGVPKLLDFGIAMLVQPEHASGSAALPSALTPEYASPEQVRREPVTTATDVYALGLLLFELLTGCRAQPLRAFEPEEIVRVVCDALPPPPSAVAPPARRRRLAGDLDAIVARALRKDPRARYGSARELADEVRRHLDHLPVGARGGGALYRAGRFVRRHRTALAAGVLVAISVLGGTVAAVREARRAERRFDDVRKLAGSFLFEVHDAIRDLPGATPARRLVVSKALEYLDSLSREAAGDRGLLRELATAYQRVGDVQGYTANANLGDTAGAARSFRKSVAVAEQLVDAAPADAAARLTLAVGLEKVGTMETALGHRAAARAALDRARAILAPLGRERPRDRDVVKAAHVVEIRSGQLLQEQDDYDGALARYRAARRIDESFLGLVPADHRARRDLSVALELEATVIGTRDPQRALQLFEALLPPAIALARAEPDNAELQRDLVAGYEDVAQMQDRLGMHEQALANQRQALAIAEARLRADPADLQALQDLSVRHAQIGDVLLHLQRVDEALQSYERALDVDGRVFARQPESAKAADYLGESHLDVAAVLRQLGRTGEALAHDRAAIAVADPFARRDPANGDLRAVLIEANAALGEGLLGDAGPCPPEGRAALARALELWSAAPVDPADAPRRDRDAARLAACGR